MFSMSFVLLFFISANAESIFLKDGSIIDGTIISETDKAVKLKTADDKLHEIPRKDVLRILHHTDYTLKKYIYKTDNSLVEAFIVDEDKVAYTCRVVLNSAAEFKILKSEIETISKKKIGFEPEKKEAAPSRRKEDITARAPRVRVAMGSNLSRPDVYNDLPDDYMVTSLTSIMNLDVFIYRKRNIKANGIDFFVRGSHLWVENDLNKTGINYFSVSDVNDYFGDIIPGAAAVAQIGCGQFGLGTGIRYAHGFYLAGILWQGYAMGYYQYSILDIWILANRPTADPLIFEPFDKTFDYTSHGIVGGAGIDIALFSYFGVFAEFTAGYSPAFKTRRNIEQQIIRWGVSWRTSYL